MAKKMKSEYTMNELAEAVDLPIRTIRFYIQKGLVDRPIGARKTARYLAKHVEQCLRVKRWSEDGLSLDRIAQALTAPPTDLPITPKRVGELSVTSRIHLAAGIELAIDHDASNLSQEQVRAIATAIIPLINELSHDTEQGTEK